MSRPPRDPGDLGGQRGEGGQGTEGAERANAEEGAELERNVERLLLRAKSPPHMAPAARDRVLVALRAAQAERRGEAAGRRPARATWLARGRGRLVVGGALALAAAALAVYALRRGPDAPVAEVRYDNPGPFVRRVALRDGSEVALDVGAALVERAPREVVLLAGQALFDVGEGPRGQGARAAGAPDAAVPGPAFALHTDAGTAVARATRFWARASADETEVAVARGEVELASTAGERRTLGVGEEGILRGGAGIEAGRARRLSYLAAFARAVESDAPPVAPGPRGARVAREPRWGGQVALELRELSVDVHVEDGVARTTIDQTWFNPRTRQLEGVYSFPVPHGAALSRLAMYVDGRRMEGATVGRSEGREIYESIVHERRDPALLEWMGGDAFRMRVFPLPPRREKRIFLEYTERLPRLYHTMRLVVPMPPLADPAGHARLKVRIVGGAAYELGSPSHALTVAEGGADRILGWEARQAEIGRDFVVTLREREPGKEALRRSFELGGERLALVAATPDLRAAVAASGGPTESRTERRAVVVLYDVSASRSAPELEAGRRFADGLLDALDPRDEVAFVAMAHDAVVVGAGLGPVGAVERGALRDELRQRGDGVGDSRLDLGVTAALELLRGAAAPEHHIVYLGDGVLVADGSPGARTSVGELRELLGGRARFFGVGIGDAVDRGTLDGLASATGGLALSVGEDEDLAARAFDLVAASYTPCVQKLTAVVEGADASALASATVALGAGQLCDGEELAVIAQTPVGADARTVRVKGELEGAPWELALPLAGGRPGAGYLPRLAAEWRVRELLRASPPVAGSAESPHEAEVTALAKKHFLVTPFTSLIVLETDAMYARFGLERRPAGGWAYYASPESVPVRYEPVGSESGAVDDGEVLRREPGALFASEDVRVRRVRMGGVDRTSPRTRGEGFGTGRGRLGGEHRAKYKAGAKGPSSGSVRKSAGPSHVRFTDVVAQAQPRSASVTTVFGALDPDVARAREGGGWLGDAYRGAELTAFRHGSDPGFRDLSELAPGLFDLEVDAALDYVAALPAGDDARDARALELLGQAARARAGQTFRDEARGETWRARADGSVERDALLPTGVRELARLAGGELRLDYPELGLSTRRRAAGGVAWWLATLVPAFAPGPELCLGLRVSLVDEHTVRLAPSAEPAVSDEVALPELEYVLDDAGRVTRVRQRLARGPVETRLVWGDGRVTVEVDGEPARTLAVGAVGADAVPAPAELVTVELPLRSPGYWLERVPELSDPHAVAQAERQLLASYAALGDDALLGQHLEALVAAAGAPSRGDLVLASSALARGAEHRKLVESLAAADVVRAYLAAGTGSAELARVAERFPGTGVGALAGYRALVLDLDQDRAGALRRRMEALVPRLAGAAFFRYAAVRRAAQRLGWDGALDAVAVWKLLADDAALGPAAEREIAKLLARREGRSAEAMAHLGRAFERGFELGYPLYFDWQLKEVVRGARGAQGLQLFAARWRSQVLLRGNADQALGLLEASVDPWRLGDEPLVDHLAPIARRLGEAPGTGARHAYLGAELLLGAGRPAEAERLVSPYVADASPLPEMLELAAVAAEELGDRDRAAVIVERLIAATRDSGVEMDAVRGWYEALLRLRLRGPNASPDGGLAAALAVAKRWRLEDPGNDRVDELIARALFAAARADEARRYVASIPERNPAEGAAWASAARLLASEGDLERAVGLYREAARVEPTNPTWLLAEAQTRLALAAPGDADRARTLLRRIAKRKWQDRFLPVVSDARSLLADPTLGP
ncbi:MAG: FecR domain-containing protein [Myxococcales bacterium]|nr:FecR domain-containing protein [Myxococcales bacterium]